MKAKLKTSCIVSACVLASGVLSACITRTEYTDLYGQALDAEAVTHHVITIDRATRHVNIQGGDSVRFLVGGKTFAWHFNVARTIHSFDLREVAPSGMLDHEVIAHVTPDPKYLGMP